jgi:hypothetical protein
LEYGFFTVGEKGEDAAAAAADDADDEADVESGRSCSLDMPDTAQPRTPPSSDAIIYEATRRVLLMTSARMCLRFD